MTKPYVHAVTGFKRGNDYICFLEQGAYERIPKAVWAAIAISRLTCGGDWIDDGLTERVLEEWRILNENGIVPQKPYRKEKTYKEY